MSPDVTTEFVCENCAVISQMKNVLGMEIFRLEPEFFRVFATISLDAIRDNIKKGRALLAPGTKLMGVVKADAYGHGAVPVAKAIEDLVDAYGVAMPEEGVELRKAGITKPVLVLGFTAPEMAELAIRYDITMAVFQSETAKAYNETAKRLHKKAKVHIKLDTGMSRIGYLCCQESVEDIKKIAALSHVEIDGMFTHFSKADEADKTFARNQLKKYMEFARLLEEAGIKLPCKHVCNSAGIIDIPEGDLDMVRFGVTMYGMYPTDEVSKERMPVTPAMEVKTHISFIKTLPVGVGIGYSGTFITEKETRVATLSAGYGDGYPRGLSNSGRVLIHGKSAPVLGRICMDQCMVDVTDIPEAKQGDIATLLGKDGDDFISAEEIGATVGNSFHYEVVCDISKRVPRIYVRNGKIVEIKSYLPRE